MNEQPRQRPRRGCLFYSAIILLFMLLVAGIATFLGIHVFHKMLNQFTDTQAVALPPSTLSAAQAEQLRKQIESWAEAVRAGQSAAPLTLTAADLNALIATAPELKSLRGKVHVLIENGQVKGQVSVPLADLGLVWFKGRYLNGVATFGIHFNEGYLTVSALDIVVKGRQLPSIYMNKIRRQNLARNLNLDNRASVALDRLKEIRINDDQLVLVPKARDE